MSRRKDIFQVKKNHFGHPIIRARANIGVFVFNGIEYDEIHLYITAKAFELSLRNSKKWNRNVDSIGSSAIWRNLSYHWNAGESASQLETVSKEIIDSFKKGMVPDWIPPLRKEQWGGVMV